ncbi:hypothetical protein LEMLEM_LOCUS11072 [Lemmus lemmus]
MCQDGGSPLLRAAQNPGQGKPSVKDLWYLGQGPFGETEVPGDEVASSLRGPNDPVYLCQGDIQQRHAKTAVLNFSGISYRREVRQPREETEAWSWSNSFKVTALVTVAADTLEHRLCAVTTPSQLSQQFRKAEGHRKEVLCPSPSCYWGQSQYSHLACKPVLSASVIFVTL